MLPRKLILFVAQAIVVGLALAFLLTLFWPGLLRREATSIEVRETNGLTAQPATGPVSYAAAVEKAAPAGVNIKHHVVGGADAIQVFLRDGRSATAKVIGGDPETDLAVLKIDLKNLPAITLGNTEHLPVGDR